MALSSHHKCWLAGFHKVDSIKSNIFILKIDTMGYLGSRKGGEVTRVKRMFIVLAGKLPVFLDSQVQLLVGVIVFAVSTSIYKQGVGCHFNIYLMQNVAVFYVP